MDKARILVCDDELLVAEDIRACLEHFDHSVTAVASSGEEAVKYAFGTKPDLAIMDINLGGSPNGIEVAQILKDSLNIPVIFVTAYADANTLDQAKRVEPLGFVIKPFQERDLLTTLEVGMYRFQRQQAQLATKTESIKTLASGVAHNINNAICVVQGSIEYLKHAKIMNDLESTLTGMALQECQRTASIVTKLLWFSDGKSPEAKETVLSNLMNEVVEETAVLINNKISLDIEPALEPYVASVSPRLMREAVKNIILNASDAMPDGEEIGVCLFREFQAEPRRFNPVAQPGWYAVIQVDDTGKGIPLEDLQRVFEPFFTTKPDGSRIGLGLSLTHGVLQDSGGWIDIKSREGSGTTVRLYVPQANSSEFKKISNAETDGLKI